MEPEELHCPSAAPEQTQVPLGVSDNRIHLREATTPNGCNVNNQVAKEALRNIIIRSVRSSSWGPGVMLPPFVRDSGWLLPIANIVPTLAD